MTGPQARSQLILADVLGLQNGTSSVDGLVKGAKIRFVMGVDLFWVLHLQFKVLKGKNRLNLRHGF